MVLVVMRGASTAADALLDGLLRRRGRTREYHQGRQHDRYDQREELAPAHTGSPPFRFGLVLYHS